MHPSASTIPPRRRPISSSPRTSTSAVRSILEAVADIDIRDAYPLMDQVASAEGWDDPEMDVYNH